VLDKKTFFLVLFQLFLAGIVISFLLYAAKEVRQAETYVCYYDITERSGVFHKFCVENSSFCKYCQYLGTMYVEGISRYRPPIAEMNLSLNLS
jgi:hypothetical protein